MISNLRYSSGQASLVGDRHNNQDRCILLQSGGVILLGLADGMGGHPRGEAAAQILMDSCNRLLQGSAKPIRDPRGFLTRTLREAHEEIQVFGLAQKPVIDPRTTAVVALVQGNTAYWAHAGDSRLYLLRDGEVLVRTTDHSYVERLRQQGMISDQQTQSHPHRNYVTRCLGGTGPLQEVEIGSHRVQPGDTLMLCSDGLWSAVDQGLMGDVLCGAMPLAEAVQALAEEATQASYPESDNTTLLAIRLEQETAQESTQSTAREAPEQHGELDQAIADLQNAIDSYQKEKE